MLANSQTLYCPSCVFPMMSGLWFPLRPAVFNDLLPYISEYSPLFIVISENFFGREWTEKELHELLNRQNDSGQKIILPLLHNISIRQLEDKYPKVADIHAISTADHSFDEIAFLFAEQLIKRLKEERV